MKKIILSLFVIIPLAGICQSSLKLWYQQPAKVWTEALPIGNGRIGAMIFGGVNEELIQLNESTLWSGGPVKINVNPDAPKYLPQIREALLKEEDYDKANALTKKMQGLYSESFLPMGDVIIKQSFNGAPSSYYRDINIQDAIATTRFTINGTEYKRRFLLPRPIILWLFALQLINQDS